MLHDVLLILALLLPACLSAYLLWERRLVFKQLRETSEAQLQTLDKALVMIGTKDPLAFQAVQAMDHVPYAGADAPVVRRATEEEDDLNGYETAALSELGIPGF